MSRFVLLYHDCPPSYGRSSHWDLMLEAKGALRTWALARLPRPWARLQEQTAEHDADCPPTAATDLIDAERLGDHRLAYLEYEGPLNSSRGQVTRIDSGIYITEAESSEEWRVHVNGRLWCGRLTLRQTRGDSRKWQLVVESFSDE